MNFQSLGFDGISQQERDANKRFYDSLSSVGGVITDFGKSFGNYAARKKAEEDEKRKWDNMLEEQKYRREQDAYNRFYQEQRDKVADQRYADELERTLEKQRREEDALAAAKKQLQDNPMYSPARIRMEYGQQAYDAAIARENAPTYADFMNAQRDFDSAINQRLMYKLQKDQFDREAPGRYADDLVKQSRSRLSKAGVDVGGSYIPKVANSMKKYVYDKDSIKKQIELIDAELAGLQNIEYDSDGSSSYRQSLINKRASLDRALNENGYVPEYYKYFGQ